MENEVKRDPMASRSWSYLDGMLEKMEIQKSRVERPPYMAITREAGGSGSGITHFGEFDSQSVKPTGQSAGNPVRRDALPVPFEA